jgi:hypothetical protein
MDTTLLKPLVVGAIAGSIDRFYLGEANPMRSFYFGSAVAVGNYSAEYIAPLINILPIPTVAKGLYDGKTLMERIIEIGSSSGVAYSLNKYVLNNDPYANEFLTRVGIIAVSDAVGTYAVEYFNSKPLQFLTDN